MAQKKRPARAGRRKEKNYLRYLGIAALVLVIVAVLVLLGYFLIMCFQVKQIIVKENRYCSKEEIAAWIQEDEYSSNSLYMLWKYNRKGIEYPPSVEKVEVKLKSPEQVVITVHEKTFVGYIDYNEVFLYFDKDGIASLVTNETIEGAVFVEGLDMEPENIKLGERLPVTDPGMLDRVSSLFQMTGEYGLSPQKISCEKTGFTLHFGGVRAQIGSGGFSDKLAQIPPILEKMQELYPDQTGVLHLENYGASDDSIRFEPDPNG